MIWLKFIIYFSFANPKLPFFFLRFYSPFVITFSNVDLSLGVANKSTRMIVNPDNYNEVVLTLAVDHRDALGVQFHIWAIDRLDFFQDVDLILA